jgi:hypothetical protein
MLKFLITGLVATMAGAAAAQTTPPPKKSPFLILPPQGYDYPYQGALTITRGDARTMKEICPDNSTPLTLACAIRHPAVNACHIYIAEDDVLCDVAGRSNCVNPEAPRLLYEILLRHEMGHCNGWHGHIGMRPFGSEPGTPPYVPPPDPQK